MINETEKSSVPDLCRPDFLSFLSTVYALYVLLADKSCLWVQIGY